jgi:hypothetical protein
MHLIRDDESCYANIEFRKFAMRMIAVIFFTLFSNQVFAWDGSEFGKIYQVDVTSGTNYEFRVSLNGAKRLRGNDHAWAYVNETDSNYNTYVAVLLAAKAAQQTVTLYTNRKDNSSTGYCHLGYITVR